MDISKFPQIVITLNPKTGEILRMAGPMHLQAFTVTVLAKAIQIVANHQPPQEAVDMLKTQNGDKEHS